MLLLPHTNKSVISLLLDLYVLTFLTYTLLFLLSLTSTLLSSPPRQDQRFNTWHQLSGHIWSTNYGSLRKHP